VDDLVNKIGVGLTWAGAFCPTTTIPTALLAVAEDVYNVVQAVHTSATGIFQPGFVAASSVLSTISSFSLGAAALEGAGTLLAGVSWIAPVAAAYEAACSALTVYGAVFDGVGFTMDQLIAQECGPAVSRRAQSLLGVPRLFPAGLHSPRRPQ
jgi:hypothetical protein